MALKHYETVFIVSPVLSEQQIKDAVDKIKTFLVESGAELTHEESWGLRKLAYAIDNKSTGYYQLFEFKADPSFILKFSTELRREEKVLRFQTIALDKYAIEFNEQRKQGKFKKKPETEEAAQ